MSFEPIPKCSYHFYCTKHSSRSLTSEVIINQSTNQIEWKNNNFGFGVQNTSRKSCWKDFYEISEIINQVRKRNCAICLFSNCKNYLLLISWNRHRITWSINLTWLTIFSLLLLPFSVGFCVFLISSTTSWSTKKKFMFRPQ